MQATDATPVPRHIPKAHPQAETVAQDILAQLLRDAAAWLDDALHEGDPFRIEIVLGTFRALAAIDLDQETLRDALRRIGQCHPVPLVRLPPWRDEGEGLAMMTEHERREWAHVRMCAEAHFERAMREKDEAEVTRMGLVLHELATIDPDRETFEEAFERVVRPHMRPPAPEKDLDDDLPF